MSRPERPCSRCGSPARPTGNTIGWGRWLEYRCRQGHTFYDMPRPVRFIGQGFGRRRKKG